MPCLWGCAAGDLSQDDDTPALSGPDLLSTWRHLDKRQGCGPIRGKNEDDNRTLVSFLPSLPSNRDIPQKDI